MADDDNDALKRKNAFRAVAGESLNEDGPASEAPSFNPNVSGEDADDPRRPTFGPDKYDRPPPDDPGPFPLYTPSEALEDEAPDTDRSERVDRRPYSGDPSLRPVNELNRPLGPALHRPAEPIQSGCYIFTVGKQGSGKSTLQSHLLRYLFEGEEYHTQPDGDDTYTSSVFHKLFPLWNEDWRNGWFPKATDVGRPVKLRFEVKPTIRKSLPLLKFGFWEVSGEDFQVLTHPSEQVPALLPSLDAFLSDPNNKIVFLFVCQGNDMDKDDFLFAQFLRYIKLRLKRNYAQCSAALIFADPETCQRRLQMILGQQQVGGALDITTALDKFTRQTRGLLNVLEDRATITTFSVGRLKEGTDREGRPAKQIEAPDFEDSRILFDWIYEQFTGRLPGPDPFIRFIRWLNDKLGG